MGSPVFRTRPTTDGCVVFGRESDDPRDALMSRAHARASRQGDSWRIEDLGSRNGTFVNGVRVENAVVLRSPCIVRTGMTLFVLLDDLTGLEGASTTMDDQGVVGPTLRAALERVARAAQSSHSLLITGESGVGKELAARAYHARGPNAKGPFVAVNCAAIPETLAERLFFGVVRGAFSGATGDAAGYVEAADRGVLFLDEIGELEAAVQAKLLRVLETRDVQRLGATAGRAVTTRFCFATTVSLRRAMNEGRFRGDLFFRVARAEVTIPPLRERPDEIPWLIAWQLARTCAGVVPHVRFVEACMLRRWPGNVRELLDAIERASEKASAAASSEVRAEHLDPDVGQSQDATVAPRLERALDRDTVEKAIAEHGANLSAVARELGLHRSQLYRLLKELGIDPRATQGD
jgi:DNA-binding NtrC family response regulator